MSYAFQEVNIPVLTVQNGNDLTFRDPVYLSDSWTEQNPAHMRMMNQTAYDLYITMKTSGDAFYLRSGDSILFPLAPNEQGFFYVNKFTHAVQNSALILLTYFSNREYPMQLEENSQAPPIIQSGLAETSGGQIEWGIPTSGGAHAVSTTGLNINQVRYVWTKIEYPIILIAHQFEVTTAPASNANVRIGIYQADSTLQPINAPLYDSGNIAVASGFTGIKTTTGLSIALLSSMYLVAINIDVAMGMRAVNIPSTAIDGNMGANAIIQKVVANQTFGAFPNPGTLWTTTNTGSSGMQHSIVWQWTE